MKHYKNLKILEIKQVKQKEKLKKLKLKSKQKKKKKTENIQLQKLKTKTKKQGTQKFVVPSKYINYYNNYINSSSKSNSEFSSKITNFRQQWTNSIYNYNINKIINISQKEKIINNLIASYFNLYNKQIEKNKANIKYYASKYRKRFPQKIFINFSNAKHTNSSVTLNLFTYNRYNKFIINKLRKLDLFYKTRFIIKAKKLNINYIKHKKHIKNKYILPYSISKNVKKSIAIKKKIFFNKFCLLDKNKIKFINKSIKLDNKYKLKQKIKLYLKNIKKIIKKKQKIKKTWLLTRSYKKKKGKLIVTNKIMIINKFDFIRNYLKKYKQNVNRKIFYKTKYHKNKLTKNLNLSIKTIQNVKNISDSKRKKYIQRKRRKNYKLNKFFIKFKNFILIKKKKLKFSKVRSKNFGFFFSNLKIIKKMNILNLDILEKMGLNKLPKWLFNKYKKHIYINQIKNLERKNLIIYYKQILYINKLKFQDIFLIKLKNIISKLYKKNVKFNIIDLKYPTLDSSIYTQIICLKAKTRKYGIRTILKRALRKRKRRILMKKPIIFIYKNMSIKKDLNNIYVNKLSKKNHKDLLTNNINEFYNNNNKIENIIFSSLKNKFIKGIRVEAKGRLTRRLIASKSVYKSHQIGSLRNFESSYTGLYGYLLRGHIDSNLQYTKLKSKTRNGSFGLKGWISSI